MPRDAKLDAFVSTDADSDDGLEDRAADYPDADSDDAPEEGSADDPHVDSDDELEGGSPDDPDVESDADSTMDGGVTGEPASAITPTSEWTPDGATCPTCGEQVERRWRQDGVLVCPDCKDWSEP